MLAWGLKRNVRNLLGGVQGNDLYPDCGSSFIGIYICQNSLNCTLQMYAVYYVSMFVLYIYVILYVCLFICFSHLLHSAFQNILLAVLSESIQNSMTSRYFHCHTTSLSYHDLLFR